MHLNDKAQRWMTATAVSLALFAIVVSGLSAFNSNEWWIRIWDFPRLQILTAIIVIAIALAALDWRKFWWLIASLAVAGAWQAYRILPYTIFATPEVALVDAEHDDGRCFSFISLNVLQTNRDYGRTVRMLREVDADVLLLLETDTKWQSALEPVLAGYKHRLERPIDNTYGLLFASRLPMDFGRIEDIAEADTPSVTAQLRVDRPFTLMGLHPRPPHPGQDTEERDAEILIAARRAAKLDMPVVAIGDFNDVAWSDTSQTFKRIGGHLDPRIGRGTYATFPASMPWLAWPLDHVFMTKEFTLSEIKVLEDVGSDHRPIYARICLTAREALQRNARPGAVSADDRETAADVMDEYREDQIDEAQGKQ
jgi:endonuclease/exonuclease/phosphatase (EEP) superfamily protein YafD